MIIKFRILLLSSFVILLIRRTFATKTTTTTRTASSSSSSITSPYHDYNSGERSCCRSRRNMILSLAFLTDIKKDNMISNKRNRDEAYNKKLHHVLPSQQQRLNQKIPLYKQSIRAMTIQSNDESFSMFPMSESRSDIIDHEIPSSLSSLSSNLVAMPTITSAITSTLAPNTLSGMVEQGIIDRYGLEETTRIIESWRLLDQDYIHDEYIDNDPKVHQYCHSYVPGLSIQPFWDINNINWCMKLQSKYQTIRDEFNSVTSDMDSLKQQGNNIWAGALSDDASSYGIGWKTLVLMDRGIWDPVNVNLFPVTSKLIHDLRIPCCEVFFASMEPYSKIELHSDFTNFVLTCHLSLYIPYSGSNKCRLTVGNTTKQWMNGNMLLFDTSLMHDAINDSDQTRYILMLRIWHPDLTEVERNALQYTFNCLEYPNLVSNDLTIRSETENIIKEQMKFPYIQRGGISSTGFGMTSSSLMNNNRKKKKK